MADSVTSLVPFYNGWERYDGLLRQMIQPLTADQLACGMHGLATPDL